MSLRKIIQQWRHSRIISEAVNRIGLSNKDPYLTQDWQNCRNMNAADLGRVHAARYLERKINVERAREIFNTVYSELQRREKKTEENCCSAYYRFAFFNTLYGLLGGTTKIAFPEISAEEIKKLAERNSPLGKK